MLRGCVVGCMRDTTVVLRRIVSVMVSLARCLWLLPPRPMATRATHQPHPLHQRLHLPSQAPQPLGSAAAPPMWATGHARSQYQRNKHREQHADRDDGSIKAEAIP